MTTSDVYMVTAINNNANNNYDDNNKSFMSSSSSSERQSLWWASCHLKGPLNGPVVIIPNLFLPTFSLFSSDSHCHSQILHSWPPQTQLQLLYFSQPHSSSHQRQIPPGPFGNWHQCYGRCGAPV